MSGRKRKKISCPFSSSKKPKRWKSDGTEEFGVKRGLCDCGSYYNQDECAFCPSVFHLFAGGEHSEHWLARSACWPVCLFHLCSAPRSTIRDPQCFQNPQNRSIYSKSLQPMRSIRKPIHPPLFMSYWSHLRNSTLRVANQGNGFVTVV